MSERRSPRVPFEYKELPPLKVAFRTRASFLHPERDEDDGFAAAPEGVIAVFDGMGKGLAGEFASRIARIILEARVKGSDAVKSPLMARYGVIFEEKSVIEREIRDVLREAHEMMKVSTTTVRYQELVRKRFQPDFERDFPEAVGKLDQAPFKGIFEMGLQAALKDAARNHGSTAVIAKAWTDGTKRYLTYGWIGDSRLYRWRNEGGRSALTRLTTDDTLIHLAVEAGLIPDDTDAGIDRLISFSQIEDAFKQKKLSLKGYLLFASLFKKQYGEPSPDRPLGSFPPISLIDYSSSLLTVLGGELTTPQDFKVLTVEVEPGDLFIAATDQIPKFGGDDAFREVLTAKGSATPLEIADALQKKADQLAKEVEHDDDSTVSILEV